MRIAQISTAAAPVGPYADGSVESQLWLMARELTRRGHAVTTFCVAGSQADGAIVPTLAGAYGHEKSFDDWHLCEWQSLCEAIKQSDSFDILHSYAYLWGLPVEAMSNAPLVHTTHMMPEEDTGRLWRRFPNARVIALSRHQYHAFPDLNPVAIIPPGVDSARYDFQPAPHDYVCFLGRFEPGEGPLQAIAAAKAAGIRLIMSGPANPYFRDTIQPLIDGKSVEYAGAVKGAARNELLRNARALLYPTQCAQAFDQILVESMLCGTPIVALNCGAVPEIVENGLSGFYGSAATELPDLLEKSFQLERGRIRQYAEKKFSMSQMVSNHERVYKAVCQTQGFA